MIKLGISKDYVPKWSVVQAIREIYQNFIDYGEFDVDITPIEDSDICNVKICNSYEPDTWTFLKIGFSKKGNNAIGGHGEGLKLAGLIFLRNKLKLSIRCKLGEVNPTLYTDDYLGTCYGFEVDPVTANDKFTIEFTAKKKDLKVFEDSYIKDDDILHKSTYGSIVDKPVGNIYVGKLFVCKLNNLKYSFNFNPRYVKLGRDRDVPSTWDMEYYMNQIINECSEELNLKVTDLTKREFSYGDIPAKIKKKFKPVMDDKGNMHVESGKTKITDSSVIREIVKDKTVAKRVERLQYKMISKSSKSPYRILSQLRDSIHLRTSDVPKFDAILKLSKSWKQK